MRSSRLTTLALASAFVGYSCLTASAHRNVSTRTTSDDVRGCGDLRVEFDNEPAATAEETITVPAGTSNTLTVRPPQNGGVYVIGSARKDYTVITCKAVAPGADARAQLDAIHTIANGATLSTTGVSSEDTMVYYIVDAPSDGALDLSAHNGPISVREFRGRSKLRTQNGPVSLDNVSGQVNAFAQNGPIHFRGDRGTIELETQNGPIGVDLAGTRWTDGSLTARAQNGPAQLKVPTGFTSGVRVESSNHSPWSCDGPSCGRARKDWDDNSRSFELGDGPVLVRVSTVNGPIQVRAGN